jgi:hypothetical protein
MLCSYIWLFSWSDSQTTREKSATFSTLTGLNCVHLFFLMEPVLVLSTLPHFLTLLVPLNCGGGIHSPYPWVILVSSTLSVLWHLDAEHRRFCALDILFAGLWGTYDILLSAMTGNFNIVLTVGFLNFSICILSHHIHKNQRSYVWNHSIWHLLSAAKCIAVAQLLRCAPNTKIEVQNLLSIH